MSDTLMNADSLKGIIHRVEKVEDAIRMEQEARKDIYSEARSIGLDPRIIRKIVAARKKAADARREETALLKLYSSAIGQMDLFA